MSVSVDVFTWPAVVLAPGQQLTFIHWIVDTFGHSMIDPEHWHLMSSVPDYAGARPDRPLAAASLEIVSQGATRDRVPEPGPTRIISIGLLRGETPISLTPLHFVRGW